MREEKFDEKKKHRHTHTQRDSKWLCCKNRFRNQSHCLVVQARSEMTAEMPCKTHR